jgi:hypothetical protein
MTQMWTYFPKKSPVEMSQCHNRQKPFLKFKTMGELMNNSEKFPKNVTSFLRGSENRCGAALLITNYDSAIN